MNEDLKQWQDKNEHYLSAGLNWLRLRLMRMADSFGNEKGPSRRKRSKEILRALEAMRTVEASEPPPALVILRRRFGLSRFEQEILLLCAAMELDTRTPSLCAAAQDQPNRVYPSFSLALTLFDEPAWDALSPERPLRYWRLIDINRAGTQSLIHSPIRADERIVNYIKGLNHLDDRLTSMLTPFDLLSEETHLPLSQQEIVTSSVQYIQTAMKESHVPVTQLVGLDSLSKQLAAQQTSRDLGLQLYRLPVEFLPTQPTEIEAFARLWQRESLLLPVAVYLDAHEPDPNARPEGGAPPPERSLQRFLARSNGVFFLSTREIRSDLGAATRTFDVKKPTPAEQQATWHASLGEDINGSDYPSILAGQFNLNVPTIERIVQNVAAEPDNKGRIPYERLWNACLVSTGPKLDMLAQRLEPKATWEDIVLPEEALGLLHQIADQVRQRTKVYDTWGFRQKMNRGLGISALFTGDSGTGKTMAAEVIANELNLNLFRIDLSGVVSKYIGETEKNLRRLFDAAEDGGAILFFDEADALFGKRSEVKDSHDRYANIEINYLLQRMESYGGLAILATNMKSALDQAFMRRLRFIVNFPFPGITERKRIIQKIFPPDVPKADLDYDRLARLNLAGGSISNIAINAAFMAASTDSEVTMTLLMAAARSEFRKMERPIKESEFLWQDK
ncbi:MAG: ATP-binding protein [Desulfobacteraceae bacterium]|nr:ATP-binding protein [Desulfobacteraceae bacterium]